MKEISKAEQIRENLRSAMRPGCYYSSEELMEATGYNSREIYKAMRTWSNNGMLRKRQQRDSRDIEYRLVR